jgi:hypothetical protein
MSIVKTAVQQQWQLIDPVPQHITVLDKGLVDDSMWYTVRCSKEASKWLRSLHDGQWHQHIDHNWYTVANTFDIDQETYIMLKLQWGE